MSHEAVQIAKEKYGIDLLLGEFESFGLESRYDVITLIHVLEHVPDPRTTVAACRAALRPGGLLVIAIPNDINSIKQRIKASLGRLGWERFRRLGPLALPAITLDERQEEVHLSNFTPEVLVGLLRAAGFDEIRTSLDPYYAATGLRRLRHELFYRTCAAVEGVSGANLYDTIWVEARL